MARAIWTGVITFGLVTFPVKLFTATESKDVSFHQLHDKCKTRIKEMRWCPHCERQVEWNEIVKGYEYAKDEYVVLTAEDMQDLPLASKQVVSVQSFVPLAGIDPIYFDKSYYFEPDEKASKAFALFMHVLKSRNLVAIGTVAIRSKERYCCLRLLGGTLVLNTLLYPDEIRVDPMSQLTAAKPTQQELKMANALVDMLVQPFAPKELVDHYRQVMHELVEAKVAGQGITAKKKEQNSGKVLDLMDALKASVEKARGSKKPSAAARATTRPAKAKAAMKVVSKAKPTRSRVS